MASMFKHTDKHVRDPYSQRPSNWGAGNTGFLADEMNTGDYEELMDRPYQGQSTVVLDAGSIGKRGADYANVVRGQRSHINSIAAAGVLFTTAGDKSAMEKRLFVPEDQPISRSRHSIGNEYVVHHEGQATLLAALLETMGNYDGMASRPEFAIRVLETDPYAYNSVRKLADAIGHQLIRQNITGGATAITENGFGGSYLFMELLRELFRCSMPINYEHQLLFLGSRKNREIGRDWLAYHLSLPTPDNVLRYVVQMSNSSGLPKWDPALAEAMVALTGSDQVYGQSDAANHFTRLRERSDIYWVKPEILVVPLRFTEKRSRFWWYREENHVLRDSPVQPLLARMKRLVEDEDDCAYHLFILAGRFTNQEVHELLSHSQMLHTRGYLDVLVSQMIPRTRNSDVAEFYLVDYVAPRGQLRPLVDLAQEFGGDDPVANSNGNRSISREELVNVLAGPNGQHAETPHKVQEAILRIIDLRGR